MTDIAGLLDALVERPLVPSIANIDGWWRAHLACAPESLAPSHRAVLGGFAGDRLGYAFASGYTEAMRVVGSPAQPSALRRRALCATEADGGHPKAIRCALEPRAGGGFSLTGTKTFVTLGEHAEQLVILATRGLDSSGRNQLVAVRVPASRAGVELRELPPTPFIPEIPHASAELREVAVEPDELFAGDGYLNVLKPFRTIEDCHVYLAALGWLTRVGRASDWPAATIERGLAAITALVPLASSRAPLSAGLHRALGGALAQANAHVNALDRDHEHTWARVEASVRDNWRRDRPLLAIASKVRQRRLDAARGRPD